MAAKKAKPIVIGGFCKSGTTVIAKCLAHCLGIGWQNEIREVWHIDTYATKNNPQKEIHARLKQNKEDKIITSNLKGEKLIKFPQAVYVPDLITPKAYLIIIVRHPADTICAYLERKHKFKSLKFPWSEVRNMSKRWNYAYLSLHFADADEYRVVRYEDFVISPKKVIPNLCAFIGKRQKKGLPHWYTEQALPYFNFDKKGRSIRGIGRSNLSLTKSQMHQVLKICLPAIKLLTVSHSGITEYLQ